VARGATSRWAHVLLLHLLQLGVVRATLVALEGQQGRWGSVLQPGWDSHLEVELFFGRGSRGGAR
jgi:hypothetical protein